MSFITDFKEVKQTAAKHNYSHSNWEAFVIASKLTVRRYHQGLFVLGTFLVTFNTLVTLFLLLERG